MCRSTEGWHSSTARRTRSCTSPGPRAFPRCSLEAFAAGLPTVATAVGGVEGWADGGALLIPPGDASAAADALERLAADRELRERLIEAELEIARATRPNPNASGLPRLWRGTRRAASGPRATSPAISRSCPT